MKDMKCHTRLNFFFPCSYSEHTYSMWKAFWNNSQNFIIAQGK